MRHVTTVLNEVFITDNFCKLTKVFRMRVAISKVPRHILQMRVVSRPSTRLKVVSANSDVPT